TGGATSEDLLNAGGGVFSVTVTDANGCNTVTSGTLNEPSAITSSIVPTHAGCSGSNTGEAELTVSGGAGGYTFFWSDFSTSQNAGSLEPGTYLVFITDASGCPHVDSVTINGFDAIDVQSAVSNPCTDKLDGEIKVTPAGAGPFSYNWSTGGTTDEIENIGEG